MNKHAHNLIAIKTKDKKHAKLIAHAFARKTYDLNGAGDKILIDNPEGINALERAFYLLCTSDLPCILIKLSDSEARAFPRNHDLKENTVCILAAIHCSDGCYGYSIGRCSSTFILDKERETAAGIMAIEKAFDLAIT